MNKVSLALTAVLLSVSLLAGCSANGVKTKSTDHYRSNNNGFYRPLASAAPGSMPSNFSDVPSGEWYTENIQWGSGLGIIDGYPDQTFQPNKSITRAEVMKIIKSLADKGYLTVPAGPATTPSSPAATPVVPTTPAVVPTAAPNTPVPSPVDASPTP